MGSRICRLSALLILGVLLCHPASANIIGNPIASAQSAAAEGGHVFKTTAGLLYGVTATIGATSGYLMVFDATSVPADGAVTPKLCYAIGTAINQGILIPYPVPFANGIVTVFSTTGCFTKTASNAFFSAQVR